MPKLSNIRRIVPEDFKAEEQELVSRIASSYNDFADEIYQVVNGLLDFDNMARSKVSLDVSFDANGTIIGSSTISSGLASVSLLNIGRVQNLSSTTFRLASSPYIDWTHLGNGNIKILYGRGFQAGVKYRLTLELIQ